MVGRSAIVRTLALATLGAGAFALGPMSVTPAVGEQAAGRLPAPPPGGVMGFVVDDFSIPLVPGLDSCPDGLSPTIREAYVAALPQAERERLLRPENEQELTDRWKATTVGPNGTNICSQPEMFERPLMKTLQGKTGWGLDLDKGDPDSCAHDEFTSPAGETGIDNQVYRVMGCYPNLRGKDGMGGDSLTGYKQFFASGEWTQVLLLTGVDSLENDPEVTVVYANTADRPVRDSKGAFVRGTSFTVNDTAPRFRNQLKGRIVNGVLETEPQLIQLTQTWGQGGARDIRGNRSKFTFMKGRLRLAFQADGSLHGMIGGYRPPFEEIQSPALGGIGSAVVAGIDCASHLRTLKAMADGIRDPKTGKCTAISHAMRMNAVPAHVTDVRPKLAGASVK